MLLSSTIVYCHCGEPIKMDVSWTEGQLSPTFRRYSFFGRNGHKVDECPNCGTDLVLEARFWPHGAWSALPAYPLAGDEAVLSQ